jgi:hypothetical protein
LLACTNSVDELANETGLRKTKQGLALLAEAPDVETS